MAEGEKWPTVAKDIASRIRSGEWPVGSRLPPYRDLAPVVGVAELTARKAVAWLAELGYLEVTRSVGVTVARRPPARLPKAHARRRDPVAELEARLVARIEDLEARLDEHERGHE